MALHVYNRLSQKLERFDPLENKQVKLYVCGPTVYDRAHIGHAMSAMTLSGATCNTRGTASST